MVRITEDVNKTDFLMIIGVTNDINILDESIVNYLETSFYLIFEQAKHRVHSR